MNPEKPFIPHPESWEDVAIVEWKQEPPPQLDLFGESPCNQSAAETQSSQRLR